MSDIRALIPGEKVPGLSLPIVGGGQWTLAEESPENFAMLVFYRGLHCPICSRYLGDLERRLDDFSKRGVTAVAISGDDRARADKAKAEWKLDKLRVAYGLALGDARNFGLYVSKGIGTTSSGVEEPALFSEPGLFLVRPDGTLYFATVQTMPFARPSFAEILPALDFVLAKGYPGRGEVSELPQAA